ncbi:GUN4 domain protein (plasmid) [Anabaena cylindrica PCC 7122]|uniref:GUN4 domain protein n=2 Tax=Nostocaceae TaxID=1162 RepID=K9ZS60_ANACC|nr:GUN4 domain protein [Anabaena cylindrica PCC 7122]BAY06737.1 GUN4 domain protein [Anabaena cylindrica PCC 7122]
MTGTGLIVFLIIILLVFSVVILKKNHRLNQQHNQKNIREKLSKQLSEEEEIITIPPPPILNIPKPTSISLVSEKGIDYTDLQHLLENLQWQKADAETRFILQKIGNVVNSNYLNADDIFQLSCRDLQTIDTLWLYYSNCHFGLTVQYQLWQESKQELNLFGEWVGWCKRGVFIRESELIYDLTAPVGHLPVAYIPIVGNCLWIVLDSVTWFNQKLQSCQQN